MKLRSSDDVFQVGTVRPVSLGVIHKQFLTVTDLTGSEEQGLGPGLLPRGNAMQV